MQHVTDSETQKEEETLSLSLIDGHKELENCDTSFMNNIMVMETVYITTPGKTNRAYVTEKSPVNSDANGEKSADTIDVEESLIPI